MGKAILVIDMPRSCMECDIRFRDEFSDWCAAHVSGEQSDVYDFMVRGIKPDWCPLMSAPEPQLLWHDDERDDWARGYNDCLHEIVGEEE